MIKRRMTDLDTQMIIEELCAWGNFERGRKLSWSLLEKMFPFTRQTMYSKESILTAFKGAKTALATGKKENTQTIVSQEDELKIQRLRKRIKELEGQVEAFQELWARYEYNTMRNGIDPDLLRRGLPEKPRIQ